MLECDTPVGKRRPLIDFRDPERRLWTRGARFAKPPEELLVARTTMKPDSALLELWKVPLPLMTKRLHACLVAAGVTSLDVYPAVIEDGNSGQRFEDYVAFNVTQVVAAADLEHSKFTRSEGIPGAIDFDSVAIDEAKAAGKLLFRLAESTSGLVVHAALKAKIEAAGIDTLQFLDPKDWAG